MSDGNEVKLALQPIEEQIKGLSKLTEVKIDALRESLTKDVKGLKEAQEDQRLFLTKLDERLEGKYVTKEFLAGTISLLTEKHTADITKIYERFNPIRAIFIFIATTVGAVLLVAITGFIFGGIKL